VVYTGLRYALMWILMLVWVQQAGAAITSLAGGAPVQVEADQFWLEGETNTYRAIGDVSIRGNNLQLEAQEVSWNADSGDAIATGKVSLISPGSVVRGDFLSFNLETGLGELTQGDVLLEEENFHFSGERIARTGERDFEVERGTFTSCDPEDPDWQFVASRLRVRNGRWASAKHVRFHVADIPVFYLPYLIYPIRYERESGFLEPEIGYSSRKGTELSLVYYWAMAQHMDASIGLDYLSKIGLGKSLEYRYALSRGNNGTLKAYHVSGIKDNPNSHAFSWEHDGWLPGQIRMLADTEYVSRREFLEDFGDAAEVYNQDLTESTLAFTRAWERSYAGVRFDYTQDLATGDKGVLQELPRLDLSRVRSRAGTTPLFYGIDTTSSYFWRDEGQQGKRVLLRPMLGADLHLGRYLAFEPEIAYLQRYYDSGNPEESEDAFGTYELAARIKSELTRVFEVGGERIERVRHVLEPRLSYEYRADEEQQGLPEFDFRDRVEALNVVELALVNRLTAKLIGEGDIPYYHEFLNLRLSQGFDVSEQRRNLDPGDERRRPWRPFRSELVVRPTRNSFIDVDARFDVNSGAKAPDRRTLSLDSRAGVKDARGNSLQLGYYYRPEAEKYLSGNLETVWLDPLFLQFLQRYDFRDRRNLESRLRTEYRSECWSVALTLTDRLDEQSFMISFSLGGFGELGEMGGGL